MMSPMSAEATVVRNYIDWILALPWYEETEGQARHRRGREDPRRGPLRPEEGQGAHPRVPRGAGAGEEAQGPDPLLRRPARRRQDVAGAKSIARATGRKFVRLVARRRARRGRDPRPPPHVHRRAARQDHPVAQEGRARNNPVFLLDEVDKMSTDFRGDPSAALLEVLDPEQNHTFNDHYLDLDYDLSKVMFISTANTLHGIPRAAAGPHGDHPLAGYTELEKLAIAERYLVPKQQRGERPGRRGRRRSADGARPDDHPPLHEGGRACAPSSARSPPSAARSRATCCKNGQASRLRVDRRKPRRSTSASPRFRTGEAEERGPDRARHRPGLDARWAASCSPPRSTVMPGKGKLIITGKLGEVMQESAQAAHELRPLARRALRPRPEVHREHRHPRPRPRGRHPQGRPVGRRHHGHRARLRADAHPGPPATWP